MIVNDMRPIMKAACPGVPDTWDNLYAFFLSRVRDNLHVVLCFSPVGDKFGRRAMQFPGLINGCTIDWFLPWPEEALTSGAAYARPARRLPHVYVCVCQLNGPLMPASAHFACLNARPHPALLAAGCHTASLTRRPRP